MESYNCLEARRDIDEYFANPIKVIASDVFPRILSHINPTKGKGVCALCRAYYKRRRERATRQGTEAFGPSAPLFKDDEEDKTADKSWYDFSSALVQASLRTAVNDENRVWAILDRDHGHEHRESGCCDWLVREFIGLLRQVREETFRQAQEI